MSMMRHVLGTLSDGSRDMVQLLHWGANTSLDTAACSRTHTLRTMTIGLRQPESMDSLRTSDHRAPISVNNHV